MSEIKIEHLWISLPFFAVLWKGFRFPLPLLDFWWHLKMGEVIFTTGSIPRTDIFSFTAEGKPFIVQNWLSEIIYYLLYGAGGLELLVFFNALLLAAALLPLFALCRESAESLRLGAFVATLASLTFFGNIRTQSFAFVLFAGFYWILEGYRLRKRNFLWVMPLLMLLWVNLHGSFILGLALITLYLGCETLNLLLKIPGGGALSGRELRNLLFILLLCLCATLANPEAHAVYRYIRTVAADKASQLFVTEWQAPQVDALDGLVFFYGLFFICLLTFFYARRRLALTELVLFLAFTVFAMTALRNSIWFPIVAAPILSRHLKSVPFAGLFSSQTGGWTAKIRALFSYGSDAARPRHRLNFALGTLLGLALLLFSPWIGPRLGNTRLLDPNTPVAAMAFIERNGITGRIFHPQMFGDYLIWRLWPRQKSFIDGRVHLFGETFVRDYLELFCDSAWEEKLQRYQVQYLLLNKSPELGASSKLIAQAKKSQSWRLLYEDSVCVLFERIESSRVQAALHSAAGKFQFGFRDQAIAPFTCT